MKKTLVRDHRRAAAGSAGGLHAPRSPRRAGRPGCPKHQGCDCKCRQKPDCPKTADCPKDADCPKTADCPKGADGQKKPDCPQHRQQEPAQPAR